MKLVHQWFDGGTVLGVGLIPPIAGMVPRVFVASDTDDAVPAPAECMPLKRGTTHMDKADCGAIVTHVLAAVNAVLAMGAERHPTNPEPLAWAFTTRTVSVRGRCGTGSTVEATVSLPPWNPPPRTSVHVDSFGFADLIGDVMHLANHVLLRAFHA